MRHSIWFQFLFVFMFVFSPLQVFATTQESAEVDEAAARARVSQTYGKLPLRFEINEGQMDEQVNFLSRGTGYSMFLTPTEAVMVLSRAKDKEQTETSNDLPGAKPEATEYESSTVRMQLVDSNPMPLIIPENKQQGKTNYLKGSDPQQWRTNVSNYSKVKFRQVYPGIDLVYYGNQQKLEYDFIVNPGSDYKTIQMNFAGAEKVDLDETGNLMLSTSTGNIIQQAPIIYQIENGERKLIEGQYVLQNENRVGFQVANYDPKKPLVIDPVLEYSTYLGGSTDRDQGHAITVDSSGNAYVTGSTLSTDFPTFNAIQGDQATRDTFVTKLDTSGALVYSTYLGGAGSDSGQGIAAGNSGNIYVTGGTSSIDFPTLNGIQGTHAGGFNDIFVTKLNASGVLVYSTFLGGNDNESGSGIAVDSSDNAYVAGSTASNNFPTLNATQGTYAGGFRDVFVTKLDASGALVYSTYLGGTDTDFGIGVAVNGVGSTYITGSTDSTDFPTLNAFQSDQLLTDVFVTRLDSSGALVYSTYLGGDITETGYGIAVDSASNAYVTGITTSPNFPTLNAFQGDQVLADAFVTKIDAAGALVYSTYLGGDGFEEGRGIATDDVDNAYVTGRTDSTDFPTVFPLQGDQPAGDIFVTKLAALGGVVYSTYLGGNNLDQGRGVAADDSGNAYVTGFTVSTDFLTANAIQPNHAGGFSDVIVAKISDANNSPNAPTADAGPDQTVEQTGPSGSNVILNGSSSSDPNNDPLTYNWLGIFGTASGVTPTVLIPAGTHTVSLVVSDGTFTSLPSSMSVTVQDTIAPGISVPADVSVPATGPQTPVDIGFATGTDAVGPVTIIGEFSCTTTSLGQQICETVPLAPALPSFPTGSTIVTWTATDGADNSSSAPQIVTVVGGVDNEDPVISAPANITVNTDAGLPTAVVNFPSATATDNSGSVTVTQTAGPLSGSAFPIGNTIVSWTATDPSNNTATASMIVTVISLLNARNDFDGDGDSDLLLVHDTGFVFAVTLENSVFQGFGFLLQADPAQGWTVHATADFNGDDKKDILLFNTTTGEYRVVLMDGTTVISDTVVLTLDPVFGLEPRGLGDFNGDGFSEIVVYQPASGFTALIYLNGGGFASFEIVTQIDEANNVTLKDTGDFNQDGNTDLLTFNTVTGETEVIEMDGSTPLATTSIFTLAPATGLTVEDNGEFDGDGKTDIAVLHTSGALGVFTLNGVAYQSFYVPGNLPTDFVLVNVGSYDGDNKTDFLIYNSTTGELQTAIQDGATITNFNSVINLGPAGWSYHKGKP